MELEQQLSAALAPCSGGAQLRTAVMGRVAAVAWRSSHGRRKPSRLVLLGTILAVAAAAAMLAARLLPMPAPQGAVIVPQSAAGPAQVAVVAKPPPAPAAVTTAPSLPDAQALANAVVPTVRSFRVRVMPLQNEATNPAARFAIASYYNALLQGLSAVPGLTLVDPDAGATTTEHAADFRLTITGAGPLPGGKYSTELQAAIYGPEGRYWARVTSALTGEIAPACAGAVTACDDPSSVAAMQVKLLRHAVFPASPSLRQDLEAQLLDTARTPVQRVNALASLATLQDPGAAGNPRIGPDLKALRDPAIVRAAIDVAAAATDPSLRAAVWHTMSGVRSPELVQPLIDSLQVDPARQVRVEVASTLAAGFSADPRVRAALEAAAVQDSSPLVRALAQRGLTGDAAWNKYVVATLEDTSLPPAQRIEALFHTVNQPGSLPTDLRQVLDDDAAVRALAQVLPKAWNSLPGMGTTVLLSRLGSLDHPAITAMLLDSLSKSDEPAIRRVLVSQLATRCGDSRVRAALARISTGDADPELRQTAAKALGGKVANSADPPQSPTR